MRREVIWRRRICGEREENGRRREGEEVNRKQMLQGLKSEPNGRKRRVFRVSLRMKEKRGESKGEAE